MEMFPTVTVEELSADKDKLVIKDTEVELGSSNLQVVLAEAALNSTLKRIKNEATRVFLLTWQGGKIPRGADILGHKIEWTQHGIVRTDQGKDIGAYTRLVEFGGESGQEQQMVIYLYPSVIKISA